MDINEYLLRRLFAMYEDPITTTTTTTTTISSNNIIMTYAPVMPSSGDIITHEETWLQADHDLIYTVWADGYEEVVQWDWEDEPIAMKLPPIGMTVKLRRDLPPMLKKGMEFKVLEHVGNDVKFKLGNTFYLLHASEFEKWEYGEEFIVKETIVEEPIVEAPLDLDKVDPHYYGFSSIDEMRKILGL